MKPETLSNRINRGLAYLASQQLSNGGFIGYSSPSLTDWQNLYAYQTVFGPALILNCLNQLANQPIEWPDIGRIRDKLGHFLQSERAADGSFNYWASSEPQRQITPYPNDLDDSFCAWNGLLGWQSRQLSGADLAQTIKLLLANEQTPGGPYRTWLVGHHSAPIWRDVDLAVNCNVAYFLNQAGLTAEPLNRYLGQQIERQNFRSAYYPTAYPLWYLLARSYNGSQRSQLKKIVRVQTEKLLERLESAPITARQAESLNLALCLSTLVMLQDDSQLPSSLAKSLVSNQHTDGSWPAAAVWIDPSHHGQTYYHGSSSLTTSMALEALAAHHSRSARQASKDSLLNTTSGASDRLEVQLSQQIFERAEQSLNRLSNQLRQPAKQVLTKLGASSRRSEIVLWPYLFAQSLAQPTNKPTMDKFIDLGLASLYGWMAYTIYDDFLDDEGQPGFLPAANTCHRWSLQAFRRAAEPDQAAFSAYVDQVFETMDEANAWEVAHCRFQPGQLPLKLQQLPSFGDRHNLAERSLGHLLAPIGSLVLCGHSLADPALQKIEQGLRHYLIARQLHDELHDWPDDLAAGHLSYTVCELWRDLSASRRLPQADYQLALRRQFWHHSLANICDVIDFHCQQASRAIASSHMLAAGGITDQLISRLQVATDRTRQQQKQLISFLESYRHAPKPTLLTLS